MMITESDPEVSEARPADAAIPSQRSLAAWEIASLVSSALIGEWILSAAAGRTKLIVLIPVIFAFALVFASHLLRREGARDLGLRFDNFLNALKLLALPMLVVALICLGLGLVFG